MESAGTLRVRTRVEVGRCFQVLVSEQLSNKLVSAGIRVQHYVGCQVSELMRRKRDPDSPLNAPLNRHRQGALSSSRAVRLYEQEPVVDKLSEDSMH